MQAQVFAPDARFADPADFRAGAVHFFGQVDAATQAAELAGVAPGQVRDVTALFVSDDTRWRLLRPIPMVADPDALVEIPDQAQYLVQPVPGAVYVQLVLVGLPAPDGGVTWPALAGRLGEGAGRAAGQLFTIQPDQPESCAVDPDAVAAQTQALLAEHLKLET